MLACFSFRPLTFIITIAIVTTAMKKHNCYCYISVVSSLCMLNVDVLVLPIPLKLSGVAGSQDAPCTVFWSLEGSGCGVQSRLQQRCKS